MLVQRKFARVWDMLVFHNKDLKDYRNSRRSLRRVSAVL